MLRTQCRGPHQGVFVSLMTNITFRHAECVFQKTRTEAAARRPCTAHMLPCKYSPATGSPPHCQNYNLVGKLGLTQTSPKNNTELCCWVQLTLYHVNCHLHTISLDRKECKLLKILFTIEFTLLPLLGALTSGFSSVYQPSWCASNQGCHILPRKSYSVLQQHWEIRNQL